MIAPNLFMENQSPMAHDSINCYSQDITRWFNDEAKPHRRTNKDLTIMEAKKRDSPVSTWPGPRWPQPPGSCLSTGSRRPTGRCSPAPAWRPARRPAPKRPIRPFPAFTQKKKKRSATEDGRPEKTESRTLVTLSCCSRASASFMAPMLR